MVRVNSGSVLRQIDVARYIGTSEQRVHQLADEPGFPASAPSRRYWSLATGSDRAVDRAAVVGIQTVEDSEVDRPLLGTVGGAAVWEPGKRGPLFPRAAVRPHPLRSHVGWEPDTAMLEFQRPVGG